MTKQIYGLRRNYIRSLATKTVYLILLAALFNWLLLPIDFNPQRVFAEQNRRASDEQISAGKIKKDVGGGGFYFEANRGQHDKRAKFSADGNGYKLFLTSSEAVYVIPERKTREAASTEAEVAAKVPQIPQSTRSVSVWMKLAGANENAEAVGIGELPGKHNYFRGNDPSKWQSNVPLYQRARFENVYEGIGVEWHGSEAGSIEHDFIVSPFASTQQIEWQIRGADKITVEADGSLLISTPFGDLRQNAPVTFQEIDGLRSPVESRFEQRGKTLVGFAVGDYDQSRPLTIDPVTDLDFSTFLGGDAGEAGRAITVGSDNTVYVTGETTSISFPTDTGIDDTYNGGIDVFVTRLDRNGVTLIYSTFLGGGSDDIGTAIKVDSLGNAYVTGKAAISATPFPTTPGAFDEVHNGDFDVFVSKINATGSALVYSTFVGGAGGDHVGGIAVNSTGAYIAGTTDSSDYPTTPGAFDTVLGGGGDIFVTKLDVNGENLIYSTFIGGTGTDRGTAFVLDGDGNAYTAGFSFGAPSDYPTTPGAFDTTYNGSNDVVISKLNGDGSALVYSTFIGGNGNDVAYALAIDTSQNVYITGQTASEATFPFPTTAGAFDRTPNGNIDIFVTKLNSSGDALAYSTLIGCDTNEFGLGIAVNSLGNAIVTGSTFPYAKPFPTTPDAFDTTPNGSNDVFLTKFSASGSSLVYSTFIGGNVSDAAMGIALNSSGAAFLTGTTGNGSVDFPTTAGVLQPNINGLTDAFAAKFFTPNPTLRIVTNTNDNGAGSLRQAVIDSNNSAADDLIEFSQLFNTPQTISLSSGQIDITSNIAINGTGADLLTVENTAAQSTTSRVFKISNGIVDLRGITITGANVLGPGGGIYKSGGGTLTVSNCNVSNNHPVNGEGAINHVGTLDVYNSNISGNGRGGIFNAGGALSITNSTISGNIRWGVINTTGSTTMITHSTITNTSSNGFAAVMQSGAGTMRIRSSIVAGNQIDISNSQGTIISDGYNLIGNPNSVSAFNQPGDQAGTPAAPIYAQLAPLALNGGTTLSHALLPNSKAIDKGSKFGLAGDQRGFARPFDVWDIADLVDGTDIGAFENQGLGNRSPFDFDGDGKTDISIFRPAGGNAEWWYLKSSNGGNAAVQFGASTDRMTPADFTGDGKTDIAFFRPATGQWFILRSEDFSFYAIPFGTTGDIPAPADYDGDGRADPAVFRPSNATWFINNSGGGTTISQFGAAGDQPVNSDYDGDGRSDIAVYRPSVAEWWIQRSTAGLTAFQFGAAGDKTVPGDFTGDGKADAAFWRPATGVWYILRSEDYSFFAFPFGASGDVPVPGDYDGDGRFDAAVFRPSNSTWFVSRSTAGTMIQQFGASGDLPVPSAFVR